MHEQRHKKLHEEMHKERHKKLHEEKHKKLHDKMHKVALDIQIRAQKVFGQILAEKVFSPNTGSGGIWKSPSPQIPADRLFKEIQQNQTRIKWNSNIIKQNQAEKTCFQHFQPCFQPALTHDTQENTGFQPYYPLVPADPFSRWDCFVKQPYEVLNGWMMER